MSVVCAQQTSRQAMLFQFLFFPPFETGSCFVSEANFELLDTRDSSSPNNWNDPHEHCVYTSCVLVVKSTSFEFDFLSAHLKMFRAVLTVSMFFRMFFGASYNRNFASIFQAFWTEAHSPVCRVLPILPLCESLPCLCLFLVVLACSGLATSILEGLCFWSEYSSPHGARSLHFLPHWLLSTPSQHLTFDLCYCLFFFYM